MSTALLSQSLDLHHHLSLLSFAVKAPPERNHYRESISSILVCFRGVQEAKYESTEIRR